MSFGVENDARFNNMKVNDVLDGSVSRDAPYSTTPVLSGGASIETTAGAKLVSVEQLCKGYYYNATPGAAVALTLPTAVQVQDYLASIGVITKAGLVLPDLSIFAAGASITVTAGGVDTTILGTAVINTKSAVCKTIFTAAATMSVIIVLSV